MHGLLTLRHYREHDVAGAADDAGEDEDADKA